jgi:hypothetical protein
VAENNCTSGTDVAGMPNNFLKTRKKFRLFGYTIQNSIGSMFLEDSWLYLYNSFSSGLDSFL